MNKKDLIKEVSSVTGYNQKQIRTVVNVVLKMVVERLTTSPGEGVYIKGLGSFYFPRFENFATVNVTTGDTKHEGPLFRIRNRLRFSPEEGLRNHLNKDGLRVRFYPAKKFNTNEFFDCWKLI